MGLLETVRFALQRLRGKPAQECSHLDQILDVEPQSAGCQACLDQGDTWVHLRMCMTDGLVMCCDSSKNQHASRHAREHAPGHQIVRSLEPGEDWIWCYADETLMPAPGPKGTAQTPGPE